MDKVKIFFKSNRILVILVVAAIFIVAIVRARSQTNMILFYGESCPHCQNVETYINENGIKNKIKFAEKEVSQNKTNAALMERKAKVCGLDTAQGLGVPFFFTGKDCLMGDEPIINYFKALK